jgi:hypothetical protein
MSWRRSRSKESVPRDARSSETRGTESQRARGHATGEPEEQHGDRGNFDRAVEHASDQPRLCAQGVKLMDQIDAALVRGVDFHAPGLIRRRQVPAIVLRLRKRQLGGRRREMRAQVVEDGGWDRGQHRRQPGEVALPSAVPDPQDLLGVVATLKMQALVPATCRIVAEARLPSKRTTVS